jgi:hypothetical protein
MGVLQTQERVYSMDVKLNQLLVIATAERHIHIVNLQEPTKIHKTISSPLKWQTRVVSCFSDASGFAVGSIEGRCAIQYVDDSNTAYVYSIRTFDLVQALTPLQPQLLLQVPPPARPLQSRHRARLLSQRHLFPPDTWYLQYRGL